jgi:hypothetical protein
MQKNVGNADRFIRIILGIILLLLFLSEPFDSLTGNLILLVISISMIATSFMSFCPVYTLFKINTGKLAKKKK